MTETLPDESERTWAYHATWNEPTEYADVNGNVILSSYDSSFRLLLSETKVVGEIDDGINLETDDLITTYTYTPAPGPVDRPAAGPAHR